LGDSLRELRQRTQHHQRHQQQQQNPADMKANEEEEEEERPPRHKTIMAEWEEEEEEEQHENADDDKCQKPMNERRGKWEKKMMTNANGNGNVPSSSSTGRVLPPPFMGGGRRQRRQPRNPIPAEFVGEEITRLYVWDDEEEDDEDEEEEEKEFPTQTVQYFSRKNSVSHGGFGGFCQHIFVVVVMVPIWLGNQGKRIGSGIFCFRFCASQFHPGQAIVPLPIGGVVNIRQRFFAKIIFFPSQCAIHIQSVPSSSSFRPQCQ
jgi:hypothetical protein